MRPRRPRTPRDQEALDHSLESGFARAAEKLFFNIGRIPVRQSRSTLLQPRTANLAAGQKRDLPGALSRSRDILIDIEIPQYFIERGVARSLLIMRWNHCERPPVYSVTSEAATNAPFQSAPPRAARSDSNPGSGSFGSLVDSNTTSDTSNSAATAPPQLAWQSRSDNAPPAANSGGSQNTAPAGPSANTDSSNQGASAAPPTSANTGTSANAAPPSQAKSGSSKSDTAKSTAKSSSGGTSVTGSSTDAAASAQQAATAAINATATAIPVTVAVTAAPPAPSTSGNATAPLAIAAAAIAASMSATAAAPAALSAAS